MFNVPLKSIQKQEVKIKNIGNSAIYLQFNFLNSPKINNSAVKDPKNKFYCHYATNVIKPNQ